ASPRPEGTGSPSASTRLATCALDTHHAVRTMAPSGIAAAVRERLKTGNARRRPRCSLIERARSGSRKIVAQATAKAKPSDSGPSTAASAMTNDQYRGALEPTDDCDAAFASARATTNEPIAPPARAKRIRFSQAI